MKKAYTFCFTISAFFIFLGTYLIYQGFDKKLNYYNSDVAPSLHKNVYVGGDAYNYIINSNYFTGYGVMGCAAFICATMLFCTGLYLRIKDMESSKALRQRMELEKVVSSNLPPL